MIFIANFLRALSSILHYVLIAYIWILVIRALLSWIPIPSLRPLAIITYNLTEPALRPIRKFFPPYKMGGLDLSPMIAILILIFLDMFLLDSIRNYAQHMLRQIDWRS